MGGIICLIGLGLFIIKWEIVMGILLFMNEVVWEVEFMEYCVIL